MDTPATQPERPSNLNARWQLNPGRMALIACAVCLLALGAWLMKILADGAAKVAFAEGVRARGGHIDGSYHGPQFMLDLTFNMGDWSEFLIGPGWEIMDATLIGPQFSDADLLAIAELGTVQSIYLDATSVTDSGLEHLKVQKALQKLEVRSTHITGQKLRELQAAIPGLIIEAPDIIKAP